MHKKFCVDVKILYVPEMFKRFRVFPFMERHIFRRQWSIA